MWSAASPSFLLGAGMAASIEYRALAQKSGRAPVLLGPHSWLGWNRPSVRYYINYVVGESINQMRPATGTLAVLLAAHAGSLQQYVWPRRIPHSWRFNDPYP